MLKPLLRLIVSFVLFGASGHSLAYITIEMINPEENPEKIIPQIHRFDSDELQALAQSTNDASRIFPLSVGFAIRSDSPIATVELGGTLGALVVTDQTDPKLVHHCEKQKLKDHKYLALCPFFFGILKLASDMSSDDATTMENAPGFFTYRATAIPLPIDFPWSAEASQYSITACNTFLECETASGSTKPKKMKMPPVMQNLSLDRNQSLRAEKKWKGGIDIEDVFAPKLDFLFDAPIAMTLRSPSYTGTIYRSQHRHKQYQLRIEPAEFKRKSDQRVLLSEAGEPLSWTWKIATKGTRVGDQCLSVRC